MPESVEPINYSEANMSMEMSEKEYEQVCEICEEYSWHYLDEVNNMLADKTDVEKEMIGESIGLSVEMTVTIMGQVIKNGKVDRQLLDDAIKQLKDGVLPKNIFD